MIIQVEIKLTEPLSSRYDLTPDISEYLPHQQPIFGNYSNMRIYIVRMWLNQV